jgi:hypothetical protein
MKGTDKRKIPISCDKNKKRKYRKRMKNNDSDVKKETKKEEK